LIGGPTTVASGPPSANYFTPLLKPLATPLAVGRADGATVSGIQGREYPMSEIMKITFY